MNWTWQIVVQALIVSISFGSAIYLWSLVSVFPATFGAWFAWRVLHNPDHFFKRLAFSCITAAASSVALGLSKIDFARTTENTITRFLLELGTHPAVTMGFLVAAVVFGYIEFQKMKREQISKDVKRSVGKVTLNGQFVTFTETADGQGFRGRADLEITNNTAHAISLSGATIWHSGLPPRQHAWLTESDKNVDLPPPERKEFVIDPGKSKTLTANYRFRSRLREWLKYDWARQLIDLISGDAVLRLDAAQPDGRQLIGLEPRFVRAQSVANVDSTD